MEKPHLLLYCEGFKDLGNEKQIYHLIRSKPPTLIIYNTLVLFSEMMSSVPNPKHSDV
jgi:hypothetical protein